ncbi:divisome protein SepX/GlpR [Nocardia harenae]|uniref:divisome protein SepX/GlpR n=1 Tax=Nocardia harenae TaxID=358707 RepID=UPI000832AF3B|nr:gephyrin-like molybdotransferase receptor GlpR [Nocardia harenae]
MPNSILWIGLVVLWVFVLFPMLANRHPRIRRTTDAALATRVLYRGGSKRRRKNGPHDSDPDYRPPRRTRRLPHSDDAEDRMTTSADEPVTDDEHTVTDPRTNEDRPADTDMPETEGETTADAAAEYDDAADPDDLTDEDPADEDPADEDRTEADRAREDPAGDDADPDRDARYDRDAEPGAEDAEYEDEPFGDDAPEPEPARDTSRVSARIPPAPLKAPARLDDDLYEDEDYEDEDPAPADEQKTAGPADDFVPSRRGRGGYDPEADAIARAARYTFRQRAVLGLMLTGLLCGGLGLAVAPALWWGTGLSLVVLVGYLAYLRKQVRMEEEIRRRRSARLGRGRRLAEEDDNEPAPRRERRAAVGMDRDTARLLRRRSVLLEPDDESPDFEQMETFEPAAARALRNRTDDMRRAAGE